MGTRRWLGDHVRGGLKHLPTATTPPLLGSQRHSGDDQVGDTTSLVSHFCRPSVPAARRQLQCRPQQRGCHGHTWGAVDPSMCGKQALPHPKCRRDKEWPAELQMQSQRGWEGEREAEAGLAEGPTPGTAGGAGPVLTPEPPGRARGHRPPGRRSWSFSRTPSFGEGADSSLCPHHTRENPLKEKALLP